MRHQGLEPRTRWLRAATWTCRMMSSNVEQDLFADSRRAAVERRLKDTTAKLRRHQAAIDAGVDAAALVEPMNFAQAERQAAEAEMEHLPDAATIDLAEVYAMLDQLGDVARHLNSRSPERITRVYRDLGLEVVYNNEKETVDATVSPRVVNVCVRGASAAQFTRRLLGRAGTTRGQRRTRSRCLDDRYVDLSADRRLMPRAVRRARRVVRGYGLLGRGRGPPGWRGRGARRHEP